MVSRKRGRHEMETDVDESPQEPSLLQRIRSMWEFANLAQWIFIFGRAVKIDEDMDIEDLEMECMKPHSTTLSEIGLALLKFVSSHRGLTPEIFDEYTRRQYLAKAPQRNPFGDDAEPLRFHDFDVFTQIRVLQQLTQWTMGNPDRIRERMEEQRDAEQTIWRIEAFGWDSQDRTYIVLDDNRLYRRTDPPPPAVPAPRQKKNSKKSKAARRASKRRKTSTPEGSEIDVMEEHELATEVRSDQQYDGFGGMGWECLAVTLDEYTSFVSTIEKSRDPNEKILRQRILDDVLPLLQKQEESRQRKQAQKERELLNLEKLAHAKRSSRIAGRMEQQKQEEEAREAERKKHAELLMAREEQEKWQKLEKERESRMMTREQRLKEREVRRILHEQELAHLSEDSKKIEAGEGRLSERHLKAEIERKKAALEELAEEEDWIFDCICGAYGQIDDGTHSIACDKCNIWQHSKCVGVHKSDADRADFTFVCKTCERRAKDAERAKTQPPIKIKLNRPGSSSSAALSKLDASPSAVFDANRDSPKHSSPQEATSQRPSTFLNGSSNAPSKVPQMAIWKPTQSSSASSRVIEASQTESNGHQLPPQPINNASQQPSSYIGPYANFELPKHQHVSPSGPTPNSSSPSGSFTQPSNSSTFKPNIIINGNAACVAPSSTNMQQAHAMPMQYSNIGSPIQHSPSKTLSNGYNTQPLSSEAARPRSRDSQGGHIHKFANSPSPFPNAPTLTPSHRLGASTGISQSPTPSSTPIQYGEAPSYPGIMQTPRESSEQAAISGHASALPSAAAGFSPTKHSPPRSLGANSSFGSVTPSILPPVASLTPSPQMQNLTPPVKPSEPAHGRPSGQVLGQ